MVKQNNIDLDVNDIHEFFIEHLNKIHAAKMHLVSHLPMLKEEAYVDDLKDGIQETVDDVNRQIERMRKIYSILDAEISDGKCNGLKGLVNDSFEDIKCRSVNPELRDMSILFYLHNIESVEMASFQILQMLAVKLRNEEVKRLLKENYGDAKAGRTLFLLITTKYIASA